jgi:hypothetical protein
MQSSSSSSSSSSSVGGCRQRWCEEQKQLHYCVQAKQLTHCLMYNGATLLCLQLSHCSYTAH